MTDVSLVFDRVPELGLLKKIIQKYGNLSFSIRAALSIAQEASKLSECKDKKVGCVILGKDNMFLSAGYNEFVPRYSAFMCSQNCKVCNIKHAEYNALRRLNTLDKPEKLICTLEPCANCQELIERAGITEVYFLNKTSAKNRQCKPFNGTWCQIRIAEEEQQDKKILNSKSEELGLTLAQIGKLIQDYHGSLTWPVISEENRIENARNIGLALIVEANEVLQALPWKPWKPKGYKEVDLENMVEELADLLFFMGSMLENFELSWTQLEQAFLKKLEINKQRKENGETI